VHDVAEGRITKESTFAVPEPFTESRFSDVRLLRNSSLRLPMENVIIIFSFFFQVVNGKNKLMND